MTNEALASFLIANVGTLIVIIAWWIVASLELINPVLLPTPIETFKSLFVSLFRGDLIKDFWLTLYRSLYAFAIAVVAGVPIGILLGSNERVYRSFEFLIDFFRSTPATAMFPLFLVVFGIGDFSKIAVAAFAGALVVFFNVAYGVMNTKKTRVMAAKAMGIPSWRIFVDVTFFETLPQTFIGLRTSISLTLVVIIVAEMFIGSTHGMGQRIIDSQQVFDMPQMYASIIATGVMGYALNQIFLIIEDKFVHWKGR
ncbi:MULTISPECIES: ABC transporter permease [Cyanophyceae]|uniref:ABC transporter permease n=1 Tax=Cyanophyceae TaxID=3028117 RepID=UPI001683E9A5|nr:MULTISPECIES: ABC transporter permease [Cyanophyceae]MBD1915381.1 ABC transporter permease [Phormidium sp. FACHB-77]MBD2028946.1 ABC transporter permease [Phormidium sp. FACHB-322]MBD2049393.1 ABC transporter permease [Leptolyngbya sp. FACHB-60]